MRTGYRGTFVIAWAQTEVDGQEAAPKTALSVGSTWRWNGKAVRVDGPPEVLLLEHASGEADLRRRAANTVHKLLGAAVDPGRKPQEVEVESEALNMGFEVTDGRMSYTVTLIEAPGAQMPLLMFVDRVPPAGTDLWVVRASLQPAHVNRLLDQPTGVICFTPGTRIRTADGEVPVEEIREGDRVQTVDDGCQEVLWIGQRRITGARLFAMPELRPVRIRAGAWHGTPGWRSGRLAAAPGAVARGSGAGSVQHVRGSGESRGSDRRPSRAFRPPGARSGILPSAPRPPPGGLGQWGRNRELPSRRCCARDDRSWTAGAAARVFPGLSYEPMAYGDFARRNISSAEAAILREDVA